MKFTKEQIIEATKHCIKSSGCSGCPLEKVEECEMLRWDYILSTEESLQEKLERIAPEQDEYPVITADMDDDYGTSIEVGGGIENRNAEKEPASAGTPTSSKDENLHSYDTTSDRFRQVDIKGARDRFKKIVELQKNFAKYYNDNDCEIVLIGVSDTAIQINKGIELCAVILGCNISVDKLSCNGKYTKKSIMYNEIEIIQLEENEEWL